MEKLKRLSDPEGAPQMKKLSLFIVFYFLLRRPLHLLQLRLHTCICGRVQIDLCRLSKRCAVMDAERGTQTRTHERVHERDICLLLRVKAWNVRGMHERVLNEKILQLLLRFVVVWRV